MNLHAEVRQITPWRSNSAILLTWFGIFVIFFVLNAFPKFLNFLLAAPLLGAMQNRLSALVHEGQHRHLHSSARLNDLLCAWLCAYPLGNLFSLGRRLHVKHHAHFGKEDDPNLNSYTVSQKAFRRDLIFSLFGFRLLYRVFIASLSNLTRFKSGKLLFSGSKRAAEEKHSGSDVWREWGYVAIVQLSLLIALTSFHFTFYLLWIWSRFTFCHSFNLIRLFTEHHSPFADSCPILVNVNAGWLARFFISPLNFNHHGTHHLLTQLPYYQLPAATIRLAKAREPMFKDNYLGYLFNKENI